MLSLKQFGGVVVEGSCCGAELAEGDGGDGKEKV